MAPLIGKDMSEAIFLERFAALCVDPLFHVRKVCAANFGDFSSVVGMESTENVLVSSPISEIFYRFTSQIVNKLAYEFIEHKISLFFLARKFKVFESDGPVGQSLGSYTRKFFKLRARPLNSSDWEGGTKSTNT